MSGSIFISYRRDDSPHAAARLKQELAKSYRPDQLFMDIDSIEPGLDFRKVIEDRVAECDALLAVIGPNWLSLRDETGTRRIENQNDYVRLEIESAMKRDVRVIPILVDAASIPKVEDLPESLRPLAFRSGIVVTHANFPYAIGHLCESLSKVLAPTGPTVNAPIEMSSMTAVRMPDPAQWQAKLEDQSRTRFSILLWSPKESPHRLEYIQGWPFSKVSLDGNVLLKFYFSGRRSLKFQVRSSEFTLNFTLSSHFHISKIQLWVGGLQILTS